MEWPCVTIWGGRTREPEGLRLGAGLGRRGLCLAALLGLSCLLLAPNPVSAVKVIINIDGNWSPWSRIDTPCNASCGGGVRVKTRSCTNPRPQGMDAKTCVGIDKEYFPCNTEPCDMQVSVHALAVNIQPNCIFKQ